MRVFLPFLTVAALAGCTAGPGLTVSATQCDAGQHQALVGMNIGEVYLPPRLPQRVIGPDQQVTQEYRPARLNIFVDAKGWIGRISCG